MLLFTAACSQDPQASPSENASSTEASATPAQYASYAGARRDRLCLGGPNADAAVVSHGAGDASCLARGRIENGALIPTGDESCRIPIDQQGDRITIGTPPANCSYYCGPGASLAGKTFTRMEKAEQVNDIAGDPLC